MLATVATCNLNQWALDFEGNLKRIKQSVDDARKQGARLRLGPELEIPGYGCEDHFLEDDTTTHSWEVLATLFEEGCTDGILCDFGMPIMHHGVRYNCRVMALNRRILLIRPKLFLANDGNYRETRWFTRWQQGWVLQDLLLPPVMIAATGGAQKSAPIGPGMLELNDTVVAPETCEELFTPNAPHILLALNGAEIITNGSGSHHNLRKLNTRVDLIRNASSKSGGCYLYANQIGCDGGRLYYDGCAMIGVNGAIVAQGKQFSLNEVEVVAATVDLASIRSVRAAFSSRCEQAATATAIPRIRVDFDLCASPTSTSAGTAAAAIFPTPPIAVRMHDPMEEIALGPACWLWDYLRRSGQGGYFVALSGGADSATVAALVGSMCQQVTAAVAAGDVHVLGDVRRVVGAEDYTPTDHTELAGRLFYTCYMGTTNSSAETRARARVLAGEVGARHLDTNIDSVVSALTSLFIATVGAEKTPRFAAHGGESRENLALQNIQARLRMVFGYMLAQLLPWARGGRGACLVLGTSNVDEALRGYYTKYDCSAADINPIGSISKEDLKRFLGWASGNLKYPSLAHILEAPPTAELEPITADYVQLDERDMGMTYEELGWYGRLRKQHRAGPLTMFRSLAAAWGPGSARGLEIAAVADKVKFFFRMYSVNRHKMTTLTPSYHAEEYSPDDNRHDLRQFLYNPAWGWQSRAIDRAAADMEDARRRVDGPAAMAAARAAQAQDR